MTLEEFKALPVGTIVELRNGAHRYCRVEGGYRSEKGISSQLHACSVFDILFSIGAVRVVDSLELLAEVSSENT